MHRDPRPAGALLAILLLAAVGCSPSPPDPDETASAPEPDSGDAAAAAMEHCMRQRGWEVTIEGGGLTAHVPKGQDAQFQQDHAECVEGFGYDQPPQWDQQEAEQFYDDLVEANECLRDRGYPITDPQSRSAFVEELIIDGLPRWNPYQRLLETVSAAEFDRAREQCPPPSR